MQGFDETIRSPGFGIFIIFLSLGLLEALWISFKRREIYNWKAAISSLSINVGKNIIDSLTAGIAFVALMAVYDYRIFEIKVNNISAFVLLVLLFELSYYWHHRFAHEVRWLWATHSVHHSPNEMNLSVAARLGWTGLLSLNFIFFAPLVLIGFHPIAVFLMLSMSLFYQIWIHTELIDRLPKWFEFWFNSPSHHRVHHASNQQYLDKNYGGMLIFYDRLFGTFAEENTKPKYGLVKPLITNNPFKIAFHEWINMFKDLKKIDDNKHIIPTLFAPPGWSKNYKRRMSAIKIHNPFKTNTPSQKQRNNYEQNQ